MSLFRNIELMRVPALGEIVEWHVPDFQNDKAHLAFIVGMFCGSRLLRDQTARAAPLNFAFW